MERLAEYLYSAEIARKLRADAGLSQTDAAALVGMDKRSWQAIEQQKVRIDSSLIRKFCKRADLEPGEYLAAAIKGEKGLKSMVAKMSSDIGDDADLKLYRALLGWTLDEAQEFLGISRVPLVRAESGEVPEGGRFQIEDLREKYKHILLQAREDAKSLREDGLCVTAGAYVAVPIFFDTEVLHEALPKHKSRLPTAAYYRYVAGQLLVNLLEDREAARLRVFESSEDFKRFKASKRRKT